MARRKLILSSSSTQSILSIGADNSPVGGQMPDYDMTPMSTPFHNNESINTMFSLYVKDYTEDTDYLKHSSNPICDDRCKCQVF